MRTAPCVLQKEIIQAHHRLFANDIVLADDYELFALSQYRDFSERFAQDFSRIALSGKVLDRTNG
jgi:hypothetical protein